jgi:hypothetical protein
LVPIWLKIEEWAGVISSELAPVERPKIVVRGRGDLNCRWLREWQNDLSWWDVLACVVQLRSLVHPIELDC